MNQVGILVSAIKQQIKARGLNYRDLARHLDISEASVKRVFSRNTLTLSRMDEICQLLDIDFVDLARMISSSRMDEAEIFTREQEEALAANDRLFAFFYLLASGLQPKEILAKYAFSEQESGRALASLDKLGLIERYPGNKVRLLISRNVQWIKNGPLNARHDEQVKKEFLQSGFTGADERFRLVSGELSEQEMRRLDRKITKLIAEFKETSRTRVQSPKARTHKIWLMVAYRPWIFTIVSCLKRRA